MNLLINETDIFNEVPIVKTFGYDKIKPDIRRAQIRVLKEILGQALTDSLSFSYVDGTTVQTQKDLLEYVHPALANLAVWLYVDKGNVLITNSGFQEQSSSDKKPAAQWRIDNLRQAYGNTGLDSLEDLIGFLEDNTGVYSWNVSNTRELFIQTAKEFQEYVDIKSSRLVFLSLIPLIRRIEKDRISATISADLYDAIKAEILADGSPSATNENLMDDIKGAIAHFSYADLLIEKSMISDDQGFHLLNNSISGNMQSVSPAELSRLRIRRDHHLQQGEKYLKNLADYLYANPDDYPLYKDSGLYVAGEEPSDQLTNEEDSPIFTIGI